MPSLKCPLCDKVAVSEAGESGEFWMHCYECDEDDPFIRAASRAIRETGEFSLSLVSGMTEEHRERFVARMTEWHGDLVVRLIEETTDV